MRSQAMKKPINNVNSKDLYNMELLDELEEVFQSAHDHIVSTFIKQK